MISIYYTGSFHGASHELQRYTVSLQQVGTVLMVLSSVKIKPAEGLVTRYSEKCFRYMTLIKRKHTAGFYDRRWQGTTITWIHVSDINNSTLDSIKDH